MDSITKKVFNNGRFILSIIFSFFYANVATNILQINFPKIFSSKSKSLTLAPSPPSPSVATATTTTTTTTTTTRRRRRRKATKTPSILSSKVESSTSVVATLPPPPPLATTTTTTVTTTPILTSRMSFLFSSNSESSTPTLAKIPQLLSLLPSLETTTPITPTKTPSILSSKVESSTSVATSLPPPPPLATTTTTTITTTPIPKSRMSFIFSSNSEPSTSALAKTTPLLPLSSPLATTTPITTTRTPSIISSLFDSTPYSSPWMYSTSGDLIGSESGVFMLSTNELEEYEEQYRNRKSNINIIDVPKRITQSTNVKKEYPPPIPSWRGKLIGDVPRSLSRHNVDGKLILTYERTEYSEYLEATREDGRLVIKLIVLKGQ